MTFILMCVCVCVLDHLNFLVAQPLVFIRVNENICTYTYAYKNQIKEMGFSAFGVQNINQTIVVAKDNKILGVQTQKMPF